jgi:hypothetical protein
MAYRRAIELDHPELSPRAAVNLGYVLFNQNLAAMRQLTAERQQGERHWIVEDARDVSVGRGKGGLKWRRWVRRDG